MAIAIKISDSQHGKVRYASSVVVTGIQANNRELYVGYNDALLRLDVGTETLEKLRVGDKLYYKDGYLSLTEGGVDNPAKAKPAAAEPVKSHPPKASMSHRFPTR